MDKILIEKEKEIAELKTKIVHLRDAIKCYENLVDNLNEALCELSEHG